ncbi:MAG: hypothetical protein HUU09_08185 [Candidatus Jettenia caeni]|nr:hypothetical protein [Candidatus Jettenia sp. AMX1]MDL1938512.1 hypothetical protein [Candidatus Jettenia sp. AMX1]NUN23434.1 hypothetical protein [Candidatus Jettenia caeni]
MGKKGENLDKKGVPQMGIFDWLKKQPKSQEKKQIRIQCPECGVLNQDNAVRCRYCRYEFPLTPQEEYDPKTNIIKIIPITPRKAEKDNDRENLITITRMKHADKAKHITAAGTNLTPDIFQKVIEEVSHSLAKGENPKNCKAKNYIPDNFTWDKYDEWYKKFYDAGEWPALWEAAYDYFAFEMECEDLSINELLHQLDKNELLLLAEQFNIKKVTSKSKKFIQDSLLNVIKPDDKETRNIIYSKIKELLYAKMIREKKYLYQHTLMSIASQTQKRDDWKENDVTKVEFSPALDTCSFCEELSGVYTINKIPISGKDTHPGCRCSFSTHDENSNMSSRDELKARYASGEFPMKRCPHCSKWIEGNALECRHCNKVM